MTKTLRVLVVDDDRGMSITLTAILTIKGYQAENASSGLDALQRVLESRYDCVFSDIRMPDINGVSLCRAIKMKHPDLPVVLMTAYSADAMIDEGMREGAVAVLTKPLDIDRILGFLSLARRQPEAVIVDDDRDFCETLSRLLDSQGFEVTEVTNPDELTDALGPNGKVLLLDMKLAGTDGAEVLRRVQRPYPRLPVILVTGYRDEMAPAIRVALEIGARRCLYKPFRPEELLKALRQIRHEEFAEALEGDLTVLRHALFTHRDRR